MNRAIFLDRDGVINRKGGSYYIYRKEDFVLNDGAIEALKYFLSKGYILIIITNQGGIAKGIYTEEDLWQLHEYMKAILSEKEVEIKDILHCPHHPDISNCLCRKPGTLLFEEAIRKYDIDPAASWMIGDSNIDIEAADKMGIRSILIPENGNMMELIVLKGKL
jgi:D-glycero-D-manno-heptose 1,7-bisphosphate phosphatase